MKKSEIFKEVLSAVCDCAEVSQEKVLSRTREADIVVARCLVVVYSKAYGLSSSYVQEMLSLKSHSSIVNYTRMYTCMRKTDKNFRHLDIVIGHELDNIMSTHGL